VYQLRLKKSAEKELALLSLSAINALHTKIEALAEDPFPPGYVKMKGYPNLYRIRAGSYRVLYTVERTVLIVEILKIGHRKDVYR
jgi:mRNA interferase RelE/StbE